MKAICGNVYWMRRVVIVLCLFLALFIYIGSIDSSRVFALGQNQEISKLQITDESINPGSGYAYSFKRLKENITLDLLSIFSDKKANYYLKLVSTRLAELKYVIFNKDEDDFQTSSQRYFSTAGQATQFILDKNLNSIKGPAKDLFTSQMSKLDVLRDSFPYDTAQYRFIQDDINYLTSYITQLGR